VAGSPINFEPIAHWADRILVKGGFDKHLATGLNIEDVNATLDFSGMRSINSGQNWVRVIPLCIWLE